MPEINARLADGGAAGRDRRDVLQVENRQPFGGLPGDRGHDHSVAVGEQHMEVDPGLGVGWKKRWLEFAGRQHHLLIRAVELIAIDVHVMELVVGPDLLQLSVGVASAAASPTAGYCRWSRGCPGATGR